MQATSWLSPDKRRSAFAPPVPFAVELDPGLGRVHAGRACLEDSTLFQTGFFGKGGQDPFRERFNGIVAKTGSERGLTTLSHQSHGHAGLQLAGKGRVFSHEKPSVLAGAGGLGCGPKLPVGRKRGG